MPKAKKTCKTKPTAQTADASLPSAAANADATPRQMRASTRTTQSSAPVSTRAPPKCKTCGEPRLGHAKTPCGMAGNSRRGLDAKAAAAEEAVLAAHKDLASRKIDAVVAGAIEEADGKVDRDAIAKAIADAGLVIPDGKSLNDYIPDVPEEDDEGTESVTDGGSLPTPPTTPGPPSPGPPAVTEGPDPDSEAMDVTPPEGSEGDSRPKTPVLVTVKPVKKRVKYALTNGWRSTRGGDIPLDLEGNGLKRAEYPTQAEKAKRTPRMFQAMAQKGDTLAARTGGYALCIFVPRAGAGIMRTWHSERVEVDVPGLMPDIRRQVFDALQPVRQRYMASVEEEHKAIQAKMDHWKAVAEEKDKENIRLREEVARLTALT